MSTSARSRSARSRSARTRSARSRSARDGQGVEVARAVLGVAHLMLAGRRGAPHRVLHGVLAVRQTGQAAITARIGTADAHTAGAVVDVTMLPLLLLPRFRRFALGQALLAVLLAVAEVASVGRGRR